jgi:L-fuconolactonase
LPARSKPHVHPVDERWLRLGAESGIKPTLDIVDSHIHLWDFSDPPYFAESYAQEVSGTGISSSVFVECTMAYREDGPEALASVGEVEFVRQQAESQGSSVAVAASIIGWTDLTRAEATSEALDAMETAAAGRFRGIRCRAAYDPDPQAGYGPSGIGPHLMARDDFRRGVAELHARGHLLELYAFHTQLAEVADLARAFPELPIVLNHIGGPLGIGAYVGHRDQVFAEWAAGINAVASHPNVSIKVGGFGISRIAIVNSSGLNRPPSSDEVAETCRPWVEHCLTQFGPQRSLFASNFPVDKVAMPLQTLVNALKQLTTRLGIDGQRAFFAENARRIYRI